MSLSLDLSRVPTPLSATAQAARVLRVQHVAILLEQDQG
jgi:hypothetical protein